MSDEKLIEIMARAIRHDLRIQEAQFVVVRGVLADLRAAGYKVLPYEPTVAMIHNAIHADDKRTGAETCRHLWRAMWDAAE